MSEMRNFNCPVTEEPCENARCTRLTCVQQQEKQAHYAADANERAKRKSAWDELQELIKPSPTISD